MVDDATVDSVAASVMSKDLLAANPGALLRTVYNDSVSDLYVKYGPGAGRSSFTLKMGPGDYHEIPIYKGLVTGFWSSETGVAMVTEG